MNRRFSLKKFLKFVFILFFILFIFFLGFGLGRGSQSDEISYQLINKEAKVENLDFNLYWQIWDSLHKNFLHAVNDKDLFYSSIKGLVAGTGDPYSAFLDPEETKIFSQDMGEEFSGVGIEVTTKDGKVVIVSPVKGGAAEEAGIKPNDEILSVDGKSVEGHNFMEVISWIRGKEGTQATITIKRSGWPEPKDFKIKRYKITIDSAKWQFFDNIAYIQIIQFSEKTYSLVNQASQEILDRHPQGIILDLRHNPGGYFQASVDIASLFVEKGPLVFEKDKSGQTKAYSAKGKASLKDYKLIVLIDSGSASASEILAGALKDYGRAELLGEKTFGKGVMQTWETFDDGSSMVLTTAFWLTPKRYEIDKKGIQPDIIISSDKTDCSADDKVCQKAKELIIK